MFKRILVPLDGSPRAESAIPVAARIARTLGSSVVLLQVATTPLDYGPYYTQPSKYSKAVIDTELEEANKYLQGVAKSSELAGVNTEVKALTGAVAPEILDHSLHADLIVMSSHGYSGLARWMLGSVADKVTRHSPIPVLVLREGGPVPAAATQQTVQALVSLDGSPLSEAVLEPAAHLVAALAEATSRQGVLHLLRVVDLPASGKFKSDAHIDSGVREQARHEAEVYLAALADRLLEDELAYPDIAIATSVEFDPDVAEAIVQMAERGNFDMIAMATHGRGGLERWAMGSVTERVLNATKLPLLIMRPQQVQAGPESKGGKETESVVAEVAEIDVQS